mgnify:CR=1 FL=1
MFKGLRTKIETEAQGNIEISSALQNDGPRLRDGQTNPLSRDDQNADAQKQTDQNSNSTLVDSSQSWNNVNCDAHEKSTRTVQDLEGQILELEIKLSSVIKERDEGYDQNAQLYQLIEKLRRNLDSEKETNSSLQRRLDEVELSSRERNISIDRISARNSNFISDQSSGEQSEDPQSLKKTIHELQNQLSEKTRQLRIKNQNLCDLKRALQRELADHNKTQRELCKLQDQLKESQVREEKGDCVVAQCSSNADLDSSSKLSLDSGSSDKHEDVSANFNIREQEEITVQTSRTPQLDSLSILSKSSAGVDDIESNDLQQSSCKEVNQEYLRNVLFRYMTSTDAETMQHLVRALSVLMKFSPEQSAAIKAATNGRLSWFRLK